MRDHRNMLAGQRRAVILEEVRRRGGARVSELTVLFGVSDMTVRRDLEALARQGSLRKVHGGAVPVAEARGHEPGFAVKSARSPEAKRHIAERAAPLVRPGAVVGLSGGTTVHAVARELRRVPALTVVTNSLRVAEVFDTAATDPPHPTVVLTGGVRTPSEALVGPVADAAVSSLHLDLLVLGAHGLGAETGLTTPNLSEAETNRRFVSSAHRVVVVADHTKWGVTGLSSFAALAEVDVLVTDAAPGREAAVALRAADVELIIAG